MTQNISLRLLAVGLLASVALACQPEQNRPVLEDKRETCVTSDQCPRGEVCKEGLCIIGDCVVREDCPKPNDQLCNELNRCIPDPDSPIGNECPNGDRDCDMGQFCSAGNCYSVADSIPCMRGTDCGAGERCDPINSFCVEDRGGCNRADEYPELACLETEACNAVTGHCEVLHGAECTEATQEEDCPPDLVCINERCVQCTTNESCEEPGNLCCEGFGTQCNVATGRCVSAFVCSAHEDCQECLLRPGLGDQAYCSDGRTCSGDGECSHLSDRRCATSTGECIQPECTDDNDCDDRWACDPATLRCYLPPAECAESNEPNNGISSATVVSGSTYSDVLCRGDVDYLQLQGHANTRLRVTIGISPADNADGISVSLLDSGGAPQDSDTFDWSTDELRVQADVVADAPYYLALQGGATASDVFNYTVTVYELEPLQCDSEPGEPNDDFAQAVNSTLPVGSVLRALCGENDEDFHQIVAPANLRTIVTVAFLDSEGDIEIDLLDSTGSELDSSDGYADSELVRYTAGDASETLVLRVARDVYYGFEEEQEYTVTITTEEPPTCSDAFEPNDTLSQADNSPLAVGTQGRTLCGEEDEDYHQLIAPAGLRTVVTVTFINDEGNIGIDLLDDEGRELDSSDSYSDNVERVTTTAGAEELTLALYVSRSLYSVVEEVQAYTIEVTTDEGPGTCGDPYEPNDTMLLAPSVGAGTHEGFICFEDDEDYFAVELPGGGDISATLTFSDADGDLDLKLLNSAGTSLDSSAGTSDTEEVSKTGLEMGNYYVHVHPFSNQVEGQTYSLELAIAHDCIDDRLEGWGNDTFEEALPLRDDALESFLLDETLKLCGDDDDWYRLLLLGDEVLELELTGPAGIGAELYRHGDDDIELVAASRELLVEAELSESYLGYKVPGRGALYYLRVAGGGGDEASYDLTVSTSIDVCAEETLEFDDTSGFATLVREPGLSVSGALCPARDVDQLHVPLIAGTAVDVAVSFDSAVADLDLEVTLVDQSVDYTPAANSGGPATEGFSHVATAPGELLIAIVRRDGSSPAPLDYDLTVDVTGGPGEDAGVPEVDAGVPEVDASTTGEDGGGLEDGGAPGSVDGGD